MKRPVFEHQTPASELMTRELVVVSPQARLHELLEALDQAQVSGLPVVDENSALVGVVTRGDVLRALRSDCDPAPRSAPQQWVFPSLALDWRCEPAELDVRLHELRVADVFSSEVVTIRPETPAREIARAMLAHLVHRVFVTEDDRLLGLVSTWDLLPILAELEREKG